MKLAVEPGSSHEPIPVDGAAGDTEDFGDLLFGETGKIAEFDDAALAGTDVGEAAQGIIEGEDIFTWLGSSNLQFFEPGDLLIAAAPG